MRRAASRARDLLVPANQFLEVLLALHADVLIQRHRHGSLGSGADERQTGRIVRLSGPPFRLLLLVVLVFAVGAGRPQLAEPTHLKMIVGLTDDTAKWMLRQEGVVGVHRDLRLMAVRVTIPWRPGQVRPTPLQQTYLHRIARMIVLHDRIVLSVYNRAAFAPVDDPARGEYCAFLRGVLRRLPLVRDVQIWNEANNPAFWPERRGAEAYEALLERCWDVLHRQSPAVNVISSTAPRHGAVPFIHALGAAYRESGRPTRLFDTFGHNPYPQDSAEPPSTVHEAGDYLGEGDYASLIATIKAAFGDTGQPLPGTDGVSLWYLETGFQTTPAPDKRRFYRGRENDAHVLPAVAEEQGATVDQASQLRDAIRLAYCQPAVTGFFNFELLDEDKLGGWQSGLLWRDGTRKPSYDAFKQLVAEVRAKSVDCAKVPGAPAAER